MGTVMSLLKYLVLFIFMFVISGCVSIIDATTDEPIKPDPNERSFGGYIDDKNLKTVVAVNIKKASAALDEAHINVHVFNAVVLLTGEVQSQTQRDLAGKTARDVSRVRQVYNELLVQPTSKFMDRTVDNVMQTKIKAKLMLDKDIDSGKVTVIVENDVAYLMGLLTRVQTDKITDVVRQQPGIKKVVRAIEYIEE